jgi:hypothetical protein
MKLVTIVLLLQFFCRSIAAQNLTTADLTWEADQTTDLQTNEAKPYQATFKTKGDKSFEWVQKKGQLSTHYTVVSVEGSWENVAQSGTATFVLERNGKNLRARFERNLSGVFITLIYPGAVVDARLQFRVKSVTL